MDFKFKDENKKSEDENTENEATDSLEYEGETFATVPPESREEEETYYTPETPPEGEEQYYSDSTSEETYVDVPEPEDDAATEKIEYGVQVGGSGTVAAGGAVAGAGAAGADPTAARPKFRIPTEEEEARRHPFRLPLKQIALVLILLGGGYYVKTYHSKEDKPKRIETPQVVEAPRPADTKTSIEELSGILNESKELLRSQREQEQRLKEQELARRNSRQAGSRKINFQALKDYKGQWVILMMKDGLQREGRIVDVKDQIVHLEQDYEYGSISVRVPVHSIADVRE
ncbi:MAG: hypothetical protein GTO40_02970 [Deltaproteobacteria bacterium]|nr:hypothetical protein [Deltaproteobacteria bacterium]